VLDALAAFDAASGTNAPLADFPPLAALFTGDGEAAQAFVAAYAEVLAREPLAHVPHRHFTDGINSTLLVGRAGSVALTLVAIDGAGLAAKPPPRSVSFSPIEVWERVLGGAAEAEAVTATPTGPDRATLKARPLTLVPGTMLARNARHTALVYRRMPSRLVMLSLQRRARVAEEVREYALADGRLLHRAAGSPRDSRHELFVSLLGAMARADAAPLLAEIARGTGADALRWQALREGLGLDTATGFAALDAVARDPHDLLAPAAASLRAHLIETYPELQELMPCPA